MTRASLVESAVAVRARAARPLFLVTNAGPPCAPTEGLSMPWIVHELFERERLPYVRVDVAFPEETIVNDGHPGTAAVRRMADAVERALRAGD